MLKSQKKNGDTGGTGRLLSHGGAVPADGGRITSIRTSLRVCRVLKSIISSMPTDRPSTRLRRQASRKSTWTETSLRIPSGLGGNAAGFLTHSATHRARPDLHCVLHTHTAAGVGVSGGRDGKPT